MLQQRLPGTGVYPELLESPCTLLRLPHCGSGKDVQGRSCRDFVLHGVSKLNASELGDMLPSGLTVLFLGILKGMRFLGNPVLCVLEEAEDLMRSLFVSHQENGCR